MAVKASATVTLSCYRDTQSITRYYKLHSSTASAPSKPTTNPPPSGWTDAEPSYTSGSTNTLYFCDLSVFSDGTWSYSTVSKSSAYEAAKEAYNKAVAAGNAADNANNKIDGLEIGGRNYFSNKTSSAFNETNEFTLANYQNTGSFTKFRNLTVPMSYFVGKKCVLSFDCISPNGSTPILVYNFNGSPRYLMNATGIISPINNKWIHQELIITVRDCGDSSRYNEYDSNKIEIYCPAQMGCKVKNVKLEIGNKATDWTPAPEDVATAEEVDNAQTAADNAQASADSNSERITASESEIRQLAEMISMLVTDGNGASMMTQTANGGWTFSMGSIVEALAKAQNDVNTLSGDMSSANSDITALKSALYDLGVLADYVIITTYNGQPCIELGEAENAFKLRITNTEIQFADGTTIPAYITNKKLMINSAEVKEEMQFGGFVWKVRSNGNLGLIWKGVDG